MTAPFGANVPGRRSRTQQKVELEFRWPPVIVRILQLLPQLEKHLRLRLKLEQVQGQFWMIGQSLAKQVLTKDSEKHGS